MHSQYVRTDLRPIRRSKLRIAAGKRWYTLRRYAGWLSSMRGLARQRLQSSLPHAAFVHSTPLYRKLRNVDMRLQANKVINLKLAVQRVDGILLHPGETFSYWRTIGKPTARKGYVDGMVLFYGTYGTGIGGGLCQLSNLIYWMTLHTPLAVKERHRHSYDVFPDANRTQPFGSGATCAYNYLDLQIHNPTKVTYQLRLSVTEEFLVGEWRAEIPQAVRYRVYEREHRITALPWGGHMRSNVIHREKYDADGTLVDDEYVTSNEALMMYEPLLSSSKENAGSGESDDGMQGNK